MPPSSASTTATTHYTITSPKICSQRAAASASAGNRNAAGTKTHREIHSADRKDRSWSAAAVGESPRSIAQQRNMNMQSRSNPINVSPVLRTNANQQTLTYSTQGSTVTSPSLPSSEHSHNVKVKWRFTHRSISPNEVKDDYENQDADTIIVSHPFFLF